MCDERTPDESGSRDDEWDDEAVRLGSTLAGCAQTLLEFATDVIEARGGYSSLVAVSFAAEVAGWMAETWDPKFAVVTLRTLADSIEAAEREQQESEHGETRPAT